MSEAKPSRVATFAKDITAGLVVFLVALPLCLGVALASNAPVLFSGLVAGIVGGIVVGLISRSHTSVSGPAAGLTAVVAAQIAFLGFDAFLVAVFLAGIIQILMGIGRMGFIAAFIPSRISSDVVSERAAKMPPEWNQRTPPAKIAFQSKSPGFNCAAASLERL